MTTIDELDHFYCLRPGCQCVHPGDFLWIDDKGNVTTQKWENGKLIGVAMSGVVDQKVDCGIEVMYGLI